MKINLSMCALFLFFFSSCNYGGKNIRVYKVKKTQQSLPEAPKQLSPNWTVPDGWESEPASSMHLAAFHAPFEGGHAKVSLMILPGDGAGLLMNVNRWLNQIGLDAGSESELPNLGEPNQGKNGSFTTYSLQNNAKPEEAFRVTVMNLGTKTLFVKMVAPIKAMNSLKPSFSAFCQSIQINE